MSPINNEIKRQSIKIYIKSELKIEETSRIFSPSLQKSSSELHLVFDNIIKMINAIIKLNSPIK